MAFVPWNVLRAHSSSFLTLTSAAAACGCSRTMLATSCGLYAVFVLFRHFVSPSVKSLRPNVMVNPILDLNLFRRSSVRYLLRKQFNLGELKIGRSLEQQTRPSSLPVFPTHFQRTCLLLQEYRNTFFRRGKIRLFFFSPNSRRFAIYMRPKIPILSGKTDLFFVCFFLCVFLCVLTASLIRN